MTHRSRKLRESARDAPRCMSCGKPNGGDLVLAHSNALEDGRGFAYKSHDVLGAILCQECHDLVDGRRGRLSREEKREMHRQAHRRTLLWWVTNGVLS